MSKNIQSTPKSSESKDNSPLDPFVEFQQLKLETERINRKMMMGPPLFNSTGNSSNEMLGMVLNELKEMRMEMKEMRQEMKEMKKDVSVMKLEQENQKERQKNIEENQKEALNSINKTLNEDGENSMKIQKEVRNVQNDVTGIKKSLEEVQRNQKHYLCALPYSKTDIRRQIYGKWKDVDNQEYFSAKFENNTFMLKEDGRNRNITYSYTQYTIGVTHHDGWTVTVENNKIMRRGTTCYGSVEWRHEYYIENERLQRMEYFNETDFFKYTFERYAYPDPG